jgi:hypothetical protein
VATDSDTVILPEQDDHYSTKDSCEELELVLNQFLKYHIKIL